MIRFCDAGWRALFAADYIDARNGRLIGLARISFIPGLFQRLGEHLYGLRARNPVFFGEDEKRYAGDTQLRGSRLIVAYRDTVVVTLQHRLCCVFGDAELRGKADQSGAIADRQAFAKIAVHDAFARVLVPRVGGGEMQQAMGVEGIAGPRLFQAILQAGLLGDLRDPGVHRRRLHQADAVFLGQPLVEGARIEGRCVGVQLEAAPYDADLVAVRELGEGGFEAAPADVAPGTNDIRPDFDLHNISSSLRRVYS